MNKTSFAKPSTVERRWLLVDGKGKTFGRLAARVAALLRGKHKPIFSPHVDTGDHVIVINAAMLHLTGNKEQTKLRYHHTGFLGGLKAEPYGELFKKDPGRALRLAIKGMLPHNDLGRLMLRKLQVYPGPDHPHQAQNPQPWDLKV